MSINGVKSNSYAFQNLVSCVAQHTRLGLAMYLLLSVFPALNDISSLRCRLNLFDIQTILVNQETGLSFEPFPIKPFVRKNQKYSLRRVNTRVTII